MEKPTSTKMLCNGLRKPSHQRSPSPVGSREPSWLNFREAAALRKKAKRAWRHLTLALALVQASVWAPTAAMPVLLICALLGSRGSIRFEEFCVLGGSHHLGVALCAMVSKYSKCKDPSLAVTLAGLSAFILAAAIRENNRLYYFAFGRLCGGIATRLAADCVPRVLEEARTTLMAFHDPERRKYNTFLENVALRFAPAVGAASGFLFAFCLALPVAARADASTHHTYQQVLPPSIGKVFAWYAGLRRSTDRVFHSKRFRPANCPQRALAARDAWSWCLLLLGVGCVLARLVLQFANSWRLNTLALLPSTLDSSTYNTVRAQQSNLTDDTPSDLKNDQHMTPVSTQRKSPLEETGSFIQKSRSTMDEYNDEDRPETKVKQSEDDVDETTDEDVRFQTQHDNTQDESLKRRSSFDRLIACAALCAESALALYFFFGAVTLEVSLKLSPREAAISLLLAYGLTIPLGTLLGACALALICSQWSIKKSKTFRRSLSAQQQAPQAPHFHPRYIELLIRDGTTAPLELFPINDHPSVINSQQPPPPLPRRFISPQMSSSSPANIKRSRKYLADHHTKKKHSDSSNESKRINSLDLEISAPDEAEPLRSSDDLEADEPKTALAFRRVQQQLQRNLARRRAACLLAITFTLVALGLGAASFLTCAKEQPARTARLGAASAMVQISVLPALALLEPYPRSSLPTTPVAALARVIPFGLAAVLSRTFPPLSRYHYNNPLPSSGQNTTDIACLEPAAPAPFRAADRVAVRAIWLFFLGLTTLCLTFAVVCGNIPAAVFSVRGYSESIQNEGDSLGFMTPPGLATNQQFSASRSTLSINTNEPDLIDSGSLLREARPPIDPSSPVSTRHQQASLGRRGRTERPISSRQQRPSSGRGKIKLLISSEPAAAPGQYESFTQLKRHLVEASTP